MPKWTEYTTKDTLADNDEVMLYDATGRANKRGLMSKFWDYVVDKMATAVIGKLETENKTVIGALNYLNGNISNIISINGDNYGFAYQKVGKIVQVHGSISAKATSITQKLDLPDPLNNISSQITFMGRSNSNGTIVRFRFNQQKELSSIDSTTENHLYIMDFSYLSK
jgi:hypothetical protein